MSMAEINLRKFSSHPRSKHLSPFHVHSFSSSLGCTRDVAFYDIALRDKFPAYFEDRDSWGFETEF